jgi:hypothetical protein
MEVDEKPTEDYNDIGGLEKEVFYLKNWWKTIGLWPIWCLFWNIC